MKPKLIVVALVSIVLCAVVLGALMIKAPNAESVRIYDREFNDPSESCEIVGKTALLSHSDAPFRVSQELRLSGVSMRLWAYSYDAPDKCAPDGSFGKVRWSIYDANSGALVYSDPSEFGLYFVTKSWRTLKTTGDAPVLSTSVDYRLTLTKTTGVSIAWEGDFGSPPIPDTLAHHSLVVWGVPYTPDVDGGDGGEPPTNESIPTNETGDEEDACPPGEILNANDVCVPQDEDEALPLWFWLIVFLLVLSAVLLAVGAIRGR